MNDFLRQALGESAVWVGQLMVGAAAVAALLAVAYWIARRLPQLRQGAGGRGRGSRLAVVDSVPLDARRRLMLVRRDAVEHLILIGGPSDVVIEPAIVRARQRQVQQAPAANLASPASDPVGSSAAAASGAAAASAETVAEPDPGPSVPFPFSRIPPARPSVARNGAATMAAEAPASDFAPSPVWPYPHTARSPFDTISDAAGSAIPRTPIVLPAAEGAIPGEASDADNGAESRLRRRAAHQVSELEAEMNRLLGQISADRRSS
jgi:hypothetical protein